MAKNELVAANSGALAALGLGEDLPTHLTKGSNRGSEAVDSNDLILPRLGQIQALSPQIKKSDAQFIEGAEQGMLFNNLTGELLGNSIVFIPVLFRKEWVVFKDRKAGGGFFGAFPTEAEALAEIENLPDSDKLEAIESHNHIGYVVTATGERQQLVFTCTKSKIKASRKLNSLVTMAGVDRFAKAYEIRSFEDQNKSGDDYWNVDVKPLGFLPLALFKEMEASYEVLKDLTIKVKHDEAEEVATEGNRPTPRRKMTEQDEKDF